MYVQLWLVHAKTRTGVTFKMTPDQTTWYYGTMHLGARTHCVGHN